MSRQQCRGAVELLAEHHLRERVRQRERGEPQQQRGLLFYRRIQPVRAADDKGRGFGKQRRELPGRQVLAALIERDDARVPGNFLADFSGFASLLSFTSLPPQSSSRL